MSKGSSTGRGAWVRSPALRSVVRAAASASAVAGGALWTAALAIAFHDPAAALWTAALALVWIAMFAIQLLQGRSSGFPGWVGFVLLAAGTALFVLGYIVGGFAYPVTSPLAAYGFELIWLSQLPFAMGARRAEMVPLLGPLLLILGWFMATIGGTLGIGGPAAFVPFGVAWILIGAGLIPRFPSLGLRRRETPR